MNRVAIPMDDTDDLPRAHAGYRLLESLGRDADKDWRETIKKYVDAALPHYPELAGRTITVGRLNPDDKAVATADWYNDFIQFKTDNIPPIDTVFHELAHLAIWKRHQEGEDVPHTSEPFCSLTAISRIPPRWIQRSDISYIGTPQIPTEEWPGVCERALEYRERHHNYIAKAKEWLKVKDEQPRTLWEM